VYGPPRLSEVDTRQVSFLVQILKIIGLWRRAGEAMSAHEGEGDYTSKETGCQLVEAALTPPPTTRPLEYRHYW